MSGVSLHDGFGYRRRRRQVHAARPALTTAPVSMGHCHEASGTPTIAATMKAPAKTNNVSTTKRPPDGPDLFETGAAVGVPQR